AGGWFFINANKWTHPIVERIFYTAGLISIYAAYLLVLFDYSEWVPDLIEAELQVLPLLSVMFVLRKRTWKEFSSILNHVQFVVVLFIAAYLVVDAIQSHTIWDAWIIGGLSLISMIFGMQFRIKSYFFVGMGVLIFNVLYQTRPYWGNVPWWVYLLVAGLLLIGIASYNEWQKQRSNSDKPLESKLKRLWLSFKNWN
ncbi:SCO7613 C-terminal domain-containing membrane protein, partial [Halobacillus sp. BBL2006]|uniref:SCO7613 C-terminal domain-containing membrane protein n=1 Tax=Halobacillus sp. BBL2006 TaxID=1543706 RepID=UPI000542FF3B